MDKRLKLQEIIVLGFLNLSLFVGAGNLIFPPFVKLVELSPRVAHIRVEGGKDCVIQVRHYRYEFLHRDSWS